MDCQLSGQKVWYPDHGSKELVGSVDDNTPAVKWILREKDLELRKNSG